MPECFRWLCLCSVIAMAGCQSAHRKSFSWLPFKSTMGNTAVAAQENPVPSAASSAVNASSGVEIPFANSSPDGGHAVSAAHLDQLLENGIRAVQDNQLDSAKASFESALKVAPDNPTAHHGLAMIADLNSNWSDSEYHYKQALRSRPRDAGLLNDLGYSYLLQNRFHEASRYLNQAIEQNPQHAKSHENLAMLALRQGDYPSAEERLRQIYPGHEINSQLRRIEQQLETLSAPPENNVAALLPEVRGDATFEEVKALAEQQRRASENARLRRSNAHLPARDIPDVTGVRTASHAGQAVETGVQFAENSSPMAAPSHEWPGQIPSAHNRTSPALNPALNNAFASAQPARFAAGFSTQSPQIPAQDSAAGSYAHPGGMGDFPGSHNAAPSFGGMAQQPVTNGMTGQGGATASHPALPQSQLNSSGNSYSAGSPAVRPTGAIVAMHAGHSATQNSANAVNNTQAQFSAPAAVVGNPQMAALGAGNNMPASAIAGSSSGYFPGAASGGANQTAVNSNFPLAGLNAGPGVLFPVDTTGSVNGQQFQFQPNGMISSTQYQPAAATHGGSQTGMLPSGGEQSGNFAAVNNQQIPHPAAAQYSHPTSTHGAMFPQTPTELPVQQLAASVSSGAAGSGAYWGGGSSSAGIDPRMQQPHLTAIGGMAQPAPQTPEGIGVSSSQNAANAAGQFYESAGGVTNAGQMPPVMAPNPLEAYDRQLQDLNSEYSQSLQQLGRHASQIQPVQARY